MCEEDRRPVTTDIAREIRLDAPSDAVWPLLVDPDALGTWLGGDVEIELRPGGRVEFRPHDAREGARHGVVDDVVEGSRLVFTWCDPDGSDQPATTVTFEIGDDDDATWLRVRETPVELVATPARFGAPLACARG